MIWSIDEYLLGLLQQILIIVVFNLPLQSACWSRILKQENELPDKQILKVLLTDIFQTDEIMHYLK